MEFKKFSVGNYSYGETQPKVKEEHMKKEGITNVNFSDETFELHVNDYQSDNFSNIHRYLEVLSVCHTVIAEKSKHSNNPDHLVYNASSPDELALVNAAKYFGYYFKGRDDDNNMVVEVKGSQEDDMGLGSNIKQF
jgi:phospholipid-transporting ATPase